MFDVLMNVDKLMKNEFGFLTICWIKMYASGFGLD